MPRTKRDAQEDEKREVAERLRQLREEMYARNSQYREDGMPPFASVTPNGE